MIWVSKATTLVLTAGMDASTQAMTEEYRMDWPMEPLWSMSRMMCQRLTRLGAISSNLETMGFPCEAALARNEIPHNEIKRVRRMLTEYGLSGWDMTYILLKDKELHKKVKRLEKISK